MSIFALQSFLIVKVMNCGVCRLNLNDTTAWRSPSSQSLTLIHSTRRPSSSSSAPPSERREGWAAPPGRNVLLLLLLPRLPVQAIGQRRQAEAGAVGPGRRRPSPKRRLGPGVRREAVRGGPDGRAFGGGEVSLRVETSTDRQRDLQTELFHH